MQAILGLSSALSVCSSSEDPSSFPIEIYSTPIALQANMAIHLSFIALLSQHNKPRLFPLKLSRAESRLGLESWHAQKIAGMAVSNHFREQFDPLFVAGLLVAAERMTHEVQQGAMSEALRGVEDKMGIKLDEQIGRLEDVWRTFRYDQR
jgi:hypothetical protein